MYVFVDMEWISNQHGNHWPTQLAAARVDAQWNTVDTFSVLFRPRDFSLQQWGHMAFSGWSREQFLDGESLYAGLDAFRLWLQPEDSIMMWFCSALLIFVSFSLLKGNYSSVHGKVFETTNDRKGYAKALGKPVLLIGICLLFSGVIAVILEHLVEAQGIVGPIPTGSAIRVSTHSWRLQRSVKP